MDGTHSNHTHPLTHTHPSTANAPSSRPHLLILLSSSHPHPPHSPPILFSQVYNKALTGTSQTLPTPYAASPIMCMNAHVGPYAKQGLGSFGYPNTDDGGSTYVTPCANVSYFTGNNTQKY